MREDKKRVIWRVAQVLISCVAAFMLIGALVYFTQGRDIPVLQPAGLIAREQYTLILITVGLGVLVVVPVFILLFSIAWRYRAGNKKARYDPELEGHRGLEALWWGIPCAIILLLAVITWVSTHALDPYKPLDSNVPPVKVQVVALEWNWLFIYPDQGVATRNFLNIPKNTPIELSITADAPMNSFWVPALAGQVYAMSGMTTKLHFMADGVGSYNGVSANISGEGYADMTFKVHSMDETAFNEWATQAARSGDALTTEVYQTIAQPSRDAPQTTYALKTPTLFDDIVMKYMMPDHTTTAETSKKHSTIPKVMEAQ